MAVTTFIPELWSARLLRELEKSLVYGQNMVVNRDYQGQIRQAGDTVHIGTIGAITVGNYTRGTGIGAPEELSTTDQTLVIDQEKFFNFMVHDIDAAQAAGQLMGPAAEEAAYALRDTADSYLVTTMAAGVDAGQKLGDTGTPLTISADTDYYDNLVDLSVLLDEQNVPESGRWVVIPPWYRGGLSKDTRLVDNVPGIIANGFVGQVDKLMVMASNNVPAVGAGSDEYQIIAGHRIASSYAEQIVDTEAFRPEEHFADALKGLHVYGFKVVRGTKLAMATVQKP